MQLDNVGEAYGKMGDFVQTLTSNIRTTSTPARQPAQSRPAQSPAREGDTDDPEDDWKRKWVYLGGIVGGGSYDSYNDSGSLAIIGFQADFCLLSFLSLGLGLYLGVDIDYGEIFPVVPALVKLGGKFGKIELTGDIGYTIGAGFTLGATFGFNAGPGILFAEVGFIPSATIGIAESLFIGFIGYKAGVGKNK
jgi:hypothetical protein